MNPRLNHHISVILLLLGLSACSSAPQTSNFNVNEYLADEYFSHFEKLEIETEKDIFELPPSLTAEIALRNSSSTPPKEQVEQLVSRIIGKPNQDILYSPMANLTAYQAYTNKAANCLSLSIMAFALAEAAGIQAQFQRVNIPEIWTRQNNVTLINGHINVKLTAKQRLNHLRIAPLAEYSRVYSNVNIYTETLDFSPELARQPFNKSIVDKQSVQAFFYNNKAAQALIDGDSQLAYRYLRSAVTLAPFDAATWTNLGLLYKRKGLMELAEKTFHKAIELEPEKLSIFDNLIVLYRETDRAEMARDIQQQLEIKRRDNPYYQALKGETAYEHGDINEAIKRFKRAIFLKDDENQFYWGMAKSYFELGDLESTYKYLTQAKASADYSDAITRYQNKLDALKHLSYARH